MILNFCLFKYFPYGGMQRDCLRLAMACKEAGYKVNILTINWNDKKPEGINIIEFPQKSFFNYKKYINFNAEVLDFINKNYISQTIKTLTIGFNKMQGLDIYYAADGCFMTKNQERSRFNRITGRFKYFKKMEHAVFSNEKDNKTKILFLIEKQRDIYQNYYKTDNSRLHIMPPVIEVLDKIEKLNYQKSINDSNINQYKENLEYGLDIAKDDLIFLLIGSGFKTKGLDRILLGLDYVKKHGFENFKLLVVGNDKASSFENMIKKLDLKSNVIFTGGRSDVAELLQAADLLLHPAYNENTGKVIIEAISSGLPVICTGVCGFAKYVKDANAGIVLDDYNQDEFNQNLNDLIFDKNKRLEFSKNGKEYGVKFQKDADAKKLLEIIKTYN